VSVLRVPLRLAAFAAVTGWGVLRVLAARARASATGRSPARAIASIQRAWGARVLRILGARVSIEGEPAGCDLLVANHLSYVDVFLLASRMEAVFVAKSEIAGWPVIGAVCRLAGTLFVDRGRRRVLPEVVAGIQEAAVPGRVVVVFPEGTSTDGSEVLPFRPALLEAAAREGLRVGWAALAYRTPEGAPPASEAVCWWRDMTLLPHLLRLLALPGFEARVTFGSETLIESDRKRLAGLLWRAVAARVTAAR
jgi:1-acyl-sn-glycerol-3-phosphate acyltransferase